jgi:host factor-I protein
VPESSLSDRVVVPAALPSIQDPFLNHARREHLAIVIRLLDGSELHGRVTGFDRFCLSVDTDGAEQLVFKHAIATVAIAGPAPHREARG